MTRTEKITEIFQRLAASRPNPKTELIYTNPFTLLVAVVLSAQATDKGVNQATKELFKVADSPAKMLKLGEEKLKSCISKINFFRGKARYIIALSEILLSQHDGQVPSDRAALEAMPGVGHKTASVVLNEIFGEPTIAVDTHVFRVSNRTGIAPGKTPLEVETKLGKVVPRKYKSGAHHWLILHGRYICLARRPKCEICMITELCDYYRSALKTDKCKRSKATSP